MKTKTLLVLVVTLLSLPSFAQKDNSKTKIMNALMQIQVYSYSWPKIWDVTESEYDYHVMYYQTESSLVDVWIGSKPKGSKPKHIELFHIVKKTTTVEWFSGTDLYKVVCEVKYYTDRKRPSIKSSVKLYYRGKKKNDRWDYFCEDIEEFARKIAADEEAIRQEKMEQKNNFSDPDDTD